MRKTGRYENRHKVKKIVRPKWGSIFRIPGVDKRLRGVLTQCKKKYNGAMTSTPKTWATRPNRTGLRTVSAGDEEIGRE
jgi:hypothetical protein